MNLLNYVDIERMIKMEYKSLHFSKSQTSILKHLYTILTDDNEILLILFKIDPFSKKKILMKLILL